MSDSKAIVSSGWSSLSTTDDFDTGVNNNINIISRTENISKATAKSLFIESLVDQLCKLFEKDPDKRHMLYQSICKKLYQMHLVEATYTLEELAPLRGFYQQALLDAIVASPTRMLSAPYLKFGCSRYANEFEEIGLVASGGFGRVFKAKNLLDQVIYAVKKIPLKYQNITVFEKKLNEVKTLAKLNHPNIVQYKAAWLEPLLDYSSQVQSPDDTNLSSNDSDLVVFENNQSSRTDSINQEENNMAVCKYSGKGVHLNSASSQISALVYLTMHLCDETLSEWLHKRNLNNFLDLSLALYIMIETTKGVQYIHSCNIVHHDIKPRNIFLSSNLKSIEVGDFGLSCLQGHDNLGCPLENGKFGTPLYAAPEQLKGCCDSKSDMFSLGLIFIELITVFSTEMERVKVLTKARSGDLPSSIPNDLLPIVKNLLSYKPSKRPNAEELIVDLQKFRKALPVSEKFNKTKEFSDSQSEAKIVEFTAIQEQKEIIRNKDKEISELRKILEQKEIEISKLKHLVAQSSKEM